MVDNQPKYLPDSQLSLWELLHLGYSLQYLRRCEQNQPIGPRGEDRLGIVGHIGNLVEGIDKLILERTDDKVGDRLRNLLTKLEKMRASNPEALLGDAVFELQAIMADLYLAIMDEASARTAFIVLPARGTPVEDLLRKPEDYFHLTMTSPLDTPEDALSDFEEAARCFSAGFSAAAVVFTFRATEAILRRYVEKVTGQEAAQQEWGKLMGRLKAASPGIPSELIQLLGELKGWRNESMHSGPRTPDNWDDAAAQRALERCRDAILRMNSDLEHRSR